MHAFIWTITNSKSPIIFLYSSYINIPPNILYLSLLLFDIKPDTYSPQSLQPSVVWDLIRFVWSAHAHAHTHRPAPCILHRHTPSSSLYLTRHLSLLYKHTLIHTRACCLLRCLMPALGANPATYWAGVRGVDVKGKYINYIYFYKPLLL